MSYIVPDYSASPTYLSDYETWTNDKPIEFSSREDYSTTVPAGQFLKCSPSIGSEIWPGQTLLVYTSKGEDPNNIPITIPNYLRQTDSLRKYQSWADANGIKIASPLLEDYDNDTTLIGECIACSPEPGSPVYIGSTITLTISKGPRPKANRGIEGLENASFPVFQRRYSISPGVYVFNRQGTDLDEYEYDQLFDTGTQGNDNITTGIGVTQDRLWNPADAPFGTGHSDFRLYRRAIFKFAPEDFSSLLSNAKPGSITAEIVITNDFYQRGSTYDVDDQNYKSKDAEYNGETPFKIDINSTLETIYDNPDDLTGKTDGMSVLNSGSCIHTNETSHTKVGRRIPITFESGGESNFIAGKLKYIVLDAYKENGVFSCLALTRANDV